VFEDTKHLVQSAVDGFNVCIFAYGQTGSGKTHTIYGSKEAPGLAPRGVAELFRIIEASKGKITFGISVYMLELYQVRGEASKRSGWDGGGLVACAAASVQAAAPEEGLLQCVVVCSECPVPGKLTTLCSCGACCLSPTTH
jgi:hypothetical protein